MNFKSILILLIIKFSFLFGIITGYSKTNYDTKDIRNMRNGHIIHKGGYSDQSFAVITKEGNWLCVITTGAGKEGQSGQHIIAMESRDKGKTWTKISDVEPPDGPHASWANPLIIPGGRIYVFYTYNKDNIRNMGRNDMLGVFAFRYSDDHGHTWSQKRYEIPIRETSIDRNNLMQGKQKFFWSVDKPIIYNKRVYMMFTKWKDFSWSVEGEGFLLKSKNILTETDPDNITWTMLPKGDVGLRGPQGPLSEEHGLVILDDGSLYTVYRTVDGYLGHAYSRDDGYTWTEPAHATYHPKGSRRLKNPRANARIEKFDNGNYILWYHNYGGRYYKYPNDLSRNPVWISGGVEKDGFVHWSEPEILLYDLDPKSRMSYPDWIHDKAGTWITETQKIVARVHPVNPELLDAVWKQGTIKTVTQKGLTLQADEKKCQTMNLKAPDFPDMSKGQGMSIDLWVKFNKFRGSQIILLAKDKKNRGFSLETTNNRTVEINLNDGQHNFNWFCDYELLKPYKTHHIVFIIDGQSKVLSVVIDGKLCDGGEYRKYGWTRFPKQLGQLKWTDELLVMPDFSTGSHRYPFEGKVKSLRIYNRYLLTSEAIANYLAEKGKYE